MSSSPPSGTQAGANDQQQSSGNNQPRRLLETPQPLLLVIPGSKKLTMANVWAECVAAGVRDLVSKVWGRRNKLKTREYSPAANFNRKRPTFHSND